MMMYTIACSGKVPVLQFQDEIVGRILSSQWVLHIIRDELPDDPKHVLVDVVGEILKEPVLLGQALVDKNTKQYIRKVIAILLEQIVTILVIVRSQHPSQQVTIDVSSCAFVYCSRL